MNSIADNNHQEVKLIEIDQSQLRQGKNGVSSFLTVPDFGAG
jgi:hypothetical protein